MPSFTMVAIAGSALDHVSVGTSIDALNWSNAATVIGVRSPERTELLAAVSTKRVSVGAGVTVIAVLAVTPAAVPMIVALPGATPRTTPAPSTLATAALLDVHATGPVAIG